MSQVSFKSIEKKLSRKNAELQEVASEIKKLEDREKELQNEIEKLQTQKVEIIFEQVKKVVKNEKLEITSETVTPILEILRESKPKIEEVENKATKTESKKLEEAVEAEKNKDMGENEDESLAEQLETISSKIA